MRLKTEPTPEWFAKARCQDIEPRVFFPDDSDYEGKARARAICVCCPVSEDCLEYALRFRIEHGIWGGIDDRGRRAILRERQKERRHRRQEGAA